MAFELSLTVRTFSQWLDFSILLMDIFWFHGVFFIPPPSGTLDPSLPAPGLHKHPKHIPLPLCLWCTVLPVTRWRDLHFPKSMPLHSRIPWLGVQSEPGNPCWISRVSSIWFWAQRVPTPRMWPLSVHSQPLLALDASFLHSSMKTGHNTPLPPRSLLWCWVHWVHLSNPLPSLVPSGLVCFWPWLGTLWHHLLQWQPDCDLQ